MALISPSFFDCVVAIGKLNPDGTKNWIGTGFLFGNYAKTREDNQKEYTIYLVTNKHVLVNQNDIVLRFNPQSDQAATDFPIKLFNDGKMIWTGHPNVNVDVAVFRINGQKLRDAGMKFHFFQSDETVYKKEDLIKIQTHEGDFVYVLGFPMGLVAPDRQYVILRGGAIARIRDLFEGRSTDFVIDAMVFPGNSGGPVIIRPEITSIEGTKANHRSCLIGIIKSYIPYQDIAISQQTKRPRVIFEENTGLSLVEPVDYIFETIAEIEKMKNVPKK